MTTEERFIGELGLLRHPEGGWYRETYRSAQHVTTQGGTTRNALTQILYLLAAHDVSRFHRLESDETWHFYRGDGIVLELIGRDGTHATERLGPEGPWQLAIPAGVHFAAHLPAGATYALVGCDVAPGFDFADFHLTPRAALQGQFPHLKQIIERYTR